MSSAILDENLMASVFNPESQKRLETDEEAFIRLCQKERALRLKKIEDFLCVYDGSVEERQAETKYESAGLDGVTACSKALMKLTDAQKSKLRGFIAACQCRGLTLIVDDKRRVYLERVDGEPINEDISNLFTWIYGFSECALLVYLSSKNNYLAYNLDVIARRFNCDIITAAYLATGIKRDLYISTCADWNFKPEYIPPELEEQIKFKPVPSNTKLHIFEVEDKHGERFKYSISCIDEVLQDALDSLGLRVISED